MWAPSCGIKFSCAFRGGGGSAVLLCTDKEKIRGGSLLLLRERIREREKESTLRRLLDALALHGRGAGGVQSVATLCGVAGVHTHTPWGVGGVGARWMI